MRGSARLVETALPSPQMRRARGARSTLTGAAARFSALLVAIACAAAQLSSTLHFALVAHTVCDEHAELIHESEGGHHHSHATRAPEPQVPAGQANVVATGAHDDDHAHCATFSDRRERLAVAPRTLDAIVLAPPASSELKLQDGARGSPVIPLLLQAPKSSPPA